MTDNNQTVVHVHDHQNIEFLHAGLTELQKTGLSTVDPSNTLTLVIKSMEIVERYFKKTPADKKAMTYQLVKYALEKLNVNGIDDIETILTLTLNNFVETVINISRNGVKINKTKCANIFKCR